MTEVNYTLVVVATLAQFILGAIWYSPLIFGKLWMKIMEATHLTQEELRKMQKEMTPFYILQLLLTLFSTFSFANLMFYTVIPGVSLYLMAFWLWIGFMAPTQIGCVIWANTKRKFWAKQIFVMITYSLAGMMLSAWILSM